MRFNPPPSWPEPPAGWIPDSSWTPPQDWPAVPQDWALWTDDSGQPIDPPPGVYGSTRKSRRGLAVVAATGTGILGLLLGSTMSSASETPGGVTTITAPGPTVTAPAVTTTATTTTTATATTTATTTATAIESVITTVKANAFAQSDSDDAAAPEVLDDPGASYFANCDAARAAGAAPVRRGDPGYGPHLDRDGDGVACE